MNDPPLYWSVQVHTYFKQTVVRPRSWVGLVVIKEREVNRKHLKKKLNLVELNYRFTGHPVSLT